MYHVIDSKYLMKYTKTIVVVALLFFSTPFFAQNGLPATAGARGLGMGNVGTTFQDIYSAFSNQAGLAHLTGLSFAIHAERRFLVEGLNSMSAAFAYPTNSGTFGLTLNYFGYGAYNEQKIGLNYARKLFDRVSIGAQFDYIGTRFDDPIYGSRASFTFELGVLAKLRKDFLVGAHVFSPIRVQLTEDNRDVIPTQFKFGLTYLPNDKLNVTAEIEKDIDYPVSFKAGMEYFLVEKLAIRAGVGTQPTQTGFGIGVYLNSVTIDLASSYHWELGFTPSISITYTMKEKKSKPKTKSQS